MSTVHSESLGVTLNGNIVTRHKVSFQALGMIVSQRHQFSVVRTGGTDEYPVFDVSYNMSEDDRNRYAGLIHRQKGENKLKKKLDTGNKGPDNDGPKPTNPRGSGGKVVEQQNTYAVAA